MTTHQTLTELQNILTSLLTAADKAIDKSWKLGGFDARPSDRLMAENYSGQYTAYKYSAEHVLRLISALTRGTGEEAKEATTYEKVCIDCNGEVSKGSNRCFYCGIHNH